MEIYITDGIGSGPTQLAAFDAALQNAGIGDFNLIELSSIIPRDSSIQIKKYSPNSNDVGHKLYIVLAKQDSCIQGDTAWAGLSWAQTSKSGEGVFAEFGSHSKEELSDYLQKSITSMKERRPGNFTHEDCHYVNIECENSPVCAVVAAVFYLEGWE